jgi:hypothetical protein
MSRMRSVSGGIVESVSALQCRVEIGLALSAQHTHPRRHCRVQSPPLPPPSPRTGVRIEDDVLLVEGGCEVLSMGVPTARGELERLVGLRPLP